MTETQAPTVWAVNLDFRSDDHVAALAAMFRDYLLEELDRIGHFPAGFPIAAWLNTLLVYVDGEPAGFLAADLTRYAIELVYVRPGYRRHGIARQMLAEMRDSCPEQMKIKAPLSPACQALTEQMGIPVSMPSADEEERGQQAVLELHQTLRSRCKHPRTGDPRRPCRRCYRNLLKKMAVVMVTEACASMRRASLAMGA
ncbi:GNAT family N-acetyltransferase [Streptomyces sp. NPDC005732]|uniref:GNAT family N-acetyltransferase n=1 Tax=Streptomyces sp. NPDC005732 TaxID=3157057 RepID=UPI0033D33BC3